MRMADRMLYSAFRASARHLYPIIKCPETPRRKILSHSITSILDVFSMYHRPSIKIGLHVLTLLTSLFVLKMRHYQAEAIKLASLLYPKPKRKLQSKQAPANPVSDVSDVEDCRVPMSDTVVYSFDDNIDILPILETEPRKVRCDDVIEMELSTFRVKKVMPCSRDTLNFDLFAQNMPLLIKQIESLKPKHSSLSEHSNDNYEPDDDFTAISSVEQVRDGSTVRMSSEAESEIVNNLDMEWRGTDTMIFNSTISGTKAQRSLAFYRILVLASEGRLEASQNTPFGPILIVYL